MQNKNARSLFATISFCACLLLTERASTQPDLVSRLATFNGGGLVSISPENVYTGISGTSNFSNPQTDLVHWNGAYYHVFTATVGDADVYLRTSPDGLTWSSPLQVNDDVPGDSAQSKPNLVVFEDVDGFTIVVVSWEDRRDASVQLRTASSNDGGLTFSASAPVSSHSNALFLTGNIAVDASDKMYAGWSVFDGGCFGTAWFSTSDDHGVSWSPMAAIYSGQCYSNNVHVSAGGEDSVVVVVSDDQFNHKNVIALHSTDGGTSFLQSSVTTFTLVQSITEYTCSTVDPSGHVHMVFTYAEFQGAITNINHATSMDWGTTWTVPVAANDLTTLFNPPSYDGGQVPAIAVAPTSGAIYVAWADQRAGAGDLDVYLSRSTDGGVAWDTDMMVNTLQAPLRQGYVSIAVDDLGGGDENVLITWNDDRFLVAVPEIAGNDGTWVSPNPATDHLNLDLLGKIVGPIHYTVLDARGAIVQMGTWAPGAQQVLDVSRLDAGLHVIRVISADRAVSIPWVKE